MMSFLEIICDSSVMPHGSSLDSAQTITSLLIASFSFFLFNRDLAPLIISKTLLVGYLSQTPGFYKN